MTKRRPKIDLAAEMTQIKDALHYLFEQQNRIIQTLIDRKIIIVPEELKDESNKV